MMIHMAGDAPYLRDEILIRSYIKPLPYLNVLSFHDVWRCRFKKDDRLFRHWIAQFDCMLSGKCLHAED